MLYQWEDSLPPSSSLSLLQEKMPGRESGCRKERTLVYQVYDPYVVAALIVEPDRPNYHHNKETTLLSNDIFNRRSVSNSWHMMMYQRKCSLHPSSFVLPSPSHVGCLNQNPTSPLCHQMPLGSLTLHLPRSDVVPHIRMFPLQHPLFLGHQDYATRLCQNLCPERRIYKVGDPSLLSVRSLDAPLGEKEAYSPRRRALFVTAEQPHDDQSLSI